MIKKIALNNAYNIINILYTSWDIFDIKKQNLSIILQLIDNNVYAALLRAKDGRTLDHLSTTQRYIEQSNVTMENKEKKKMNFVPSLFGNWGAKDET